MSNTSTVDTRSVVGLLDIMTENIISLKENDDEQTVKKANAINQSVTTILKIYGLAFSKDRLNVIRDVKAGDDKWAQLEGTTVDVDDLMGEVVGQPNDD